MCIKMIYIYFLCFIFAVYGKSCHYMSMFLYRHIIRNFFVQEEKLEKNDNYQPFAQMVPEL